MSRLKSSEIATILKDENPGVFVASKNLIISNDYVVDDAVNTEGVYISRPETNSELQVATLDGVSVYDEEVVFNILVVATPSNTYFDDARTAIENLASSEAFKCFYAKNFSADITNLDNSVQCEFTFTLKQSITK